jgi:hypothetical protein
MTGRDLFPPKDAVNDGGGAAVHAAFIERDSGFL